MEKEKDVTHVDAQTHGPTLKLCLCLCICLFVSIRLGHCHHQMISFQKIYGLYGLERHTVDING